MRSATAPPTVKLIAGGPSSRATRSPRLHALVPVYYELVTESASAEVASELSIAAARIADAETLFELCRAVSDPFAWQPFLRHLYAVAPTRRTADSDAARHRLHALAAELLHAQGLGLVRPEDLLARPTPFEEAFCSLASNTI